MAALCFTHIAPDGRAAAREIFTSLASSLRSGGSGTPLHSSPTVLNSDIRKLRRATVSRAQVAHACLRTMKLYQHDTRNHYEEDRPTFVETDSIFPDDLVETLMEHDTIPDDGFARSFFRIRRIDEKKAKIALHTTQESAADTLGAVVELGSDTSRIVNNEEVDDGTDVDSYGRYDVNDPVVTHMREPEDTAGVASQDQSEDHHNPSGSGDIDNSSETGPNTNATLPISSQIPMGVTLEGESAQTAVDDTTTTVTPSNDQEPAPHAQHNRTLNLWRVISNKVETPGAERDSSVASSISVD